MSLSWNLPYDLINLQFLTLLEGVLRLGGFNRPAGHFMAYDLLPIVCAYILPINLLSCLAENLCKNFIAYIQRGWNCFHGLNKKPGHHAGLYRSHQQGILLISFVILVNL